MNNDGIKKGLLFVGISALIFFVFYSILNSYFVTDDMRLIYISSPLSVDSILDIFTSTGGFFAGQYRPLVRMAFYIDYSLYHLNPVGYHLTNLFFHILTTIMVFYFAKVLTGSEKTGAFAAFVFAIHPLHTESVTWISGRSDLIFTFFYLSSVLAFFKYISSGRKKNVYITASVCCFALSLLSKESAVTLPLMLFLAELFYNRKYPGNIDRRIKLANYVPFIFILILYTLIKLFFIRGSLIYNIGFDTIIRVSYHFFQLFAPINIDTFNLRDVPQLILNMVLITNFAIMLFFYFYFYTDKKSLHIHAYCILWIFITWFPLYLGSGLRYVYIASIASSVLLGLIFTEGSKSLKRLNLKVSKIFMLLLITSILFTFSIRTVQRNNIYNYTGNIARSILSQIKKSYSQFPEGSVLYFINFPYKAVKDTETWMTPIPVIAMAIKVIYGDTSLVVYSNRKKLLTFEDKLQFLGRKALKEYIKDGKHYYIFEYQNGSVIEVTDILKRDRNT